MTGESHLVLDGVALCVAWEMEIDGALDDERCRAIVTDACDAAVSFGRERHGIPATAMPSYASSVQYEARTAIERRLAPSAARLRAFRVLAIRVA